MSEKVQFQTNVPVDVALKYNDGKEVTERCGDRVLYTLTDGRVMYVPPIVHKKINELGIGRGELSTITKAEKKNGTRRTIEWVVGSDGSGDRKPQRRDQQPNGTAPAQRRSGGGSTPANGNGHRPSSLSEAKGFLVTGQGQFLLQALATTVDVAAATEHYATACGLELQFTKISRVGESADALAFIQFSGERLGRCRSAILATSLNVLSNSRSGCVLLRFLIPELRIAGGKFFGN